MFGHSLVQRLQPVCDLSSDLLEHLFGWTRNTSGLDYGTSQQPPQAPSAQLQPLFASPPQGNFSATLKPSLIRWFMCYMTSITLQGSRYAYLHDPWARAGVFRAWSSHELPHLHSTAAVLVLFVSAAQPDCRQVPYPPSVSIAAFLSDLACWNDCKPCGTMKMQGKPMPEGS